MCVLQCTGWQTPAHTQHKAAPVNKRGLTPPTTHTASASRPDTCGGCRGGSTKQGGKRKSKGITSAGSRGLGGALCCVHRLRCTFPLAHSGMAQCWRVWQRMTKAGKPLSPPRQCLAGARASSNGETPSNTHTHTRTQRHAHSSRVCVRPHTRATWPTACCTTPKVWSKALCSAAQPATPGQCVKNKLIRASY
jgi:hypothetical protein